MSIKRTYQTAMCVCAAAGLLASAHALESQTQIEQKVRQTFASAKLLDWPAAAAKLLPAANGAERKATALAIVRYVVQKEPSAALPVLRAMASAAPEIAPEIAAAAVRIAPERLRDVMIAVLSGVPTHRAQVLAALCRSQPAKLDLIATTLVQHFPKEPPAMLQSISELLPGTRSIIDRRRASIRPASLGTQVTISIVAMTLREVNAIANLIVNTVNSAGGPSVTFADVAVAVLENKIVLNNDGTIQTIRTAEISSPNLQTALSTPSISSSVTQTVDTAATDSGSAYGSAIVTSSEPIDAIQPSETVEVTNTEVRAYSRP